MAHTPHSRPRRILGGPIARWAAVVATAGVVGALVTLPAAPAATAADESDSSVTIKWAGGNAPELQQYQPDHADLTSDDNGNDNGLGHWDDFKNLEVTVSKTKNLGDEVVTVKATGFSGGSTQTNRTLNSNFLQLMQCWGPDPLAAEFYETCQYGSWSEPDPACKFGCTFNGMEYRGILRHPSNAELTEIRPFRAVTGAVSKPSTLPNGWQSNGLGEFFSKFSSNEIPFVPADSRGAAEVGFEVQSSISQPYLGCGNRASAASQRCWLVVVPRGVHSGEWPASQSTGTTCGELPSDVVPSGEVMPVTQKGSPISPDCSFFQNRVVVPLEFTDIQSACPPGSVERRVVGSELAAAALSSWQTALCQQQGTAFSLVTNSGDLARAQLLRRQVDFTVVSQPLTASTIGATDPSLLEQADIQYAPLANGALVFGFVMSDLTTRVSEVKLTPRLIAKLLTQSYFSDVPGISAGVGESGSSRSVLQMTQDPEWAALDNPTTPEMSEGFKFITPGPSGDDAIAQLWRYVQSDADARAFLQGMPDPWGLTVNPYYLPGNHPEAAGEGLPIDLSKDAVSTFLRADQSRIGEFDSLSWNPYANDFHNTALRVFRADSRRTWNTDPNSYPANKPVADSVKLLTDTRNFIGPMTATDAAEYRMATASLAVPLKYPTSGESVASARSFVTPTVDAVSAAVGAEAVDSATGVGSVDFAALPDDAYPLTLTVNAAVDLASPQLDAAGRDDYARLLGYIADAGQEPGERAGQLPPGYIPLTDQQRAATRALAQQLLASTGTGDQPGEAEQPGTDSTTDPAGGGAVAAPPADTSADPATQTQVSASAETASATTGAVDSPSQAALGATLAAGAAGLIAAPFLLRRRRADA